MGADTGGGHTFTVHANDNLVARGSDAFAHDQANRLTSATIAGTTTQYAYDGDGKRLSTTVGGTTKRYVYDVGGGLPVLLDDGALKYVWGWAWSMRWRAAATAPSRCTTTAAWCGSGLPVRRDLTAAEG